MKIAKLNKVELRELWTHVHDAPRQESIRDVILFPQLKPK